MPDRRGVEFDKGLRFMCQEGTDEPQPVRLHGQQRGPNALSGVRVGEVARLPVQLFERGNGTPRLGSV